MDSVPQCQKTSLFNPFEPKNKKVNLFWSNIKSDASYNIAKLSNTKSFCSNINLDASYKIKNSIKNKTAFNVKNNISNNTSNNLDRASIDNKKEITSEGNKDKHWNIKFVEQGKAIENNHFICSVPKEWRQKGKDVEYPSAEKRLDAQIQAIERAVNHRWQMDKD